MFDFEKLLDFLFYICLWLTVDSSLLLYLENAGFHYSPIKFLCCIYPSHFIGLSIKILSYIKLVRGAWFNI